MGVILLKVGILVLSFNQFERTTKLCLDSLIDQLGSLGEGVSIDVLIFDNGSTDGSDVLLQNYLKLYPQIRLHLSRVNLGFAGGVNAAAGTLNVDWLLIVGSDIVFPVDSLRNFLNSLNDVANNVAMVGPVTNEAGNGQKLLFPDNQLETFFDVCAGKTSFPTGRKIPLYQVGFFCVAVRKSVWDELGGLDLQYERGYYEDFDFSMRAKKRGYKFLMLEDVLVYHYGSASFKVTSDLKKLIKKNKKIFLTNHPEAELRHLRLDNVYVLEEYFKEPMEIHFEVGLKKRIEWRLEALSYEMPRSFVKKILWKLKVKALTKKAHAWLASE